MLSRVFSEWFGDDDPPSGFEQKSYVAKNSASVGSNY
jgi:hypothetical protein